MVIYLRKLLWYFSSILAGGVSNNAPKIRKVMIPFKLNKRSTVPCFEGTCQITQLTICISKNCFEPYIVNKYRSLNSHFIITKLVKNSHSSMANIWGSYTELASNFFFFPCFTAYYQYGLKYYPKLWVFILRGVIGVEDFQQGAIAYLENMFEIQFSRTQK